ncbi:MAG: indole-3-glycerol phosphate synthase TrpC [Actinobacteria bacterium]|uniref:indole-3-glycerol-phosphate synthase n=1 Tax=freshwater metagenome TaxID=449393 RepID=A0A6J6CCL7_9ZZZZ|nr:indole-3-glycerol phosphate synthase TrpC [Actinomycetota bacterium]
MLQDLYKGAIEDAASREHILSFDQIEKLAAAAPSALRVRDSLYSDSRIRVIAEIKRASPSRGIIADIPDPANLAKTYQSSGAGTISVLTEGRKFLGSLVDFDQVRSSVSIPLLRKDFIATEYQVLEARAHGADMVLLIAAGLERTKLVGLKKLIEDLGMSALIETHNESEVRLACEIDSELIGINARDLETFETNRSLFGELVSLIPDSVIKIAESAVRGLADVVEYASHGADCVLVGEALVTGDAESLLTSFTEVVKP